MNNVPNPGLDSIHSALSDAPGLPFRQHWLKTPEPDFTPGTVKIGRKANCLMIFAELEDESINATGFPFNFPAFRQCDTFEIFLRAAGAPVYYEFHITPSNSLLQLRIPIPRPVTTSLNEYYVTKRLFQSRTGIDSDRWEVAVSVPLALLCGDQPIPDQWTCSFGRYDYKAGVPAPVISSTSSHTVRDFHRLAEWGTISFQSLPAIE